MALACVNITAPLAINALSDDGWRLAPGRPLYACDLPGGRRQIGECVLNGHTVAGRIALEAHQMKPQRSTLGSGSRKTKDNPRIVSEHDPDTRMIGQALIHQIDITRIRTEEHTSELQSPMCNTYDIEC